MSDLRSRAIDIAARHERAAAGDMRALGIGEKSETAALILELVAMIDAEHGFWGDPEGSRTEEATDAD